jgi:DhnA family fructose-bisphosphate aldolase class Ia
MHNHIGKAIRMNDILDARSFMLDTTKASSIGATPGLHDLEGVLRACTERFDGIIVNPGPMEHLASLLSGKTRASPLVLVDWTNAYRGADFCLPASDIKRIEISGAKDVMNLGGSAAVATFLMGFDDGFEAENIRSISLLMRECHTLSLPVFADIRPIGPKVSELNFEETIKLGTSFMMEGGADALILPRCSMETLAFIAEWSMVPLILRTDDLRDKTEADNLFDLGVKGILFSEKILEASNVLERIQALRGI